MPITKKIDDLKDETIKKRLINIFSNMKPLAQVLFDMIDGAYVLKLQIRDASVPDRVLWEAQGKLVLNQNKSSIIPVIDKELPITITLDDLKKAFRSDIQVKELPVFVCWEFQAGDRKELMPLSWPVEASLIIVSDEHPINFVASE